VTEPPRQEFFAAYDALLARWPAGCRTADLASDFGTTRVNISGPEDAPPLLLFHGYLATSAVWLAMVGELSRAYRVYAVDHIGDGGRSVAAGRPAATAADLMNWIDSLYAGLRLDAAVLCGHSYGAWLALSYAVHAPGRVRALALLDPTQCFAGFRPGYLLRGLPALARPTAARQRALIRWETGGVPVSPAWLHLTALAADLPWSRPAFTRRPSRTSLGSLTVPALVVLAERSKAHNIRRVAARARTRMRGVRVAVLPSATHHSIPAGQAAPLSQLVLGFRQETADQDGPCPESKLTGG
jgi:pimeloyl-ACP methyl ester carboxylesterase